MEKYPFNKTYNRGKKGRYFNAHRINIDKHKYKIINWEPVVFTRKISLTFNFETSKIIKYE